MRVWVALAAVTAASYQAPRKPPIAWQPQLSGVTVRLRGVSAVSALVAWTSGANGTILRTLDGGRTWTPRPLPGAETLDFRDIDALSENVAYALSIGPGAASRIYKTSDGGAHWTLQFQNRDPKMFLDAMAFADETQGVAYSDSVDGRLVILTTNTGGREWERAADDRLPPASPGEGAFAASGTNVALIGREHVWIGTSVSRVIRSTDGGRTWTATATPVATGEATGIFSIAFRDTQHGIVVGQGGGRRRQRGRHGRRRRDVDARERSRRLRVPFRRGVGAQRRRPIGDRDRSLRCRLVVGRRADVDTDPQ
jgi:photosystem II stability/assembly factor-like uncharacterized protein